MNGIERCIDDEIPFEIPDSWCWCRLKTVSNKIVDGDHNPPKGEPYQTDYIMASSTNINNDTLVELDKVRYLSKETFLIENNRTDVEIGDIFFTSVGTLGRSCVFEGGYNICFQRSVSIINTKLYNYYLKRVLDSPFIQNKITAESTGTAQKGFYLNQLKECLIPVPPLAEQFRIVESIESLMGILQK